MPPFRVAAPLECRPSPLSVHGKLRTAARRRVGSPERRHTRTAARGILFKIDSTHRPSGFPLLWYPASLACRRSVLMFDGLLRNSASRRAAGIAETSRLTSDPHSIPPEINVFSACPAPLREIDDGRINPLVSQRKNPGFGNRYRAHQGIGHREQPYPAPDSCPDPIPIPDPRP